MEGDDGSGSQHPEGFFLIPEERMNNCSFERWYGLYDGLRRKPDAADTWSSFRTFRSSIVDLSSFPEFVEYLMDEPDHNHEDSDGDDAKDLDKKNSKKEETIKKKQRGRRREGLFLPESAFPKRATYTAERDYEDDEWTRDYSDEEEEEKEEEDVSPEFKELESKVEGIIAELGGQVLPKLNWSSPKDAVWMSVGGTLRCKNFGEICLLLRSSDFIAHDLSYAYEPCYREGEGGSIEPITGDAQRPQHFHLVLRKWYALQPAMEFRCFVWNRQLIGISQRDPSKYFPFLPAMRPQITATIEDFFTKFVVPYFPDDDVVFDVYIDDHERLWLIDFNPYAPVTDALLFDWEELPIPKCVPDQFRPRSTDAPATATSQTSAPATSVPMNGERRLEFRVIESEADVRVMSAGNKFPVDAGVDVSSADSIEALVRLMQAQSN